MTTLKIAKTSLLGILILFLIQPTLALFVSGADKVVNITTDQATISTSPNPLTNTFISNDDYNLTKTLTSTQIQTIPQALSNVFISNDDKNVTKNLNPVQISTTLQSLTYMFISNDDYNLTIDLQPANVQTILQNLTSFFLSNANNRSILNLTQPSIQTEQKPLSSFFVSGADKVILLELNITKEADESPVADFTFSPKTPIPNIEVTFDASSSYDPVGYIVEYRWDFGDGTTAKGKVVKHNFTKFGNYKVTLTVIDNNGNTAQTSKIVKVLSYVPTKLEYKNIVEQNKPCEIKVLTFADSTPIPAHVKLMFHDGNFINYYRTVEGTAENGVFTYTFTPDKVGVCYFTVVTEYDGVFNIEYGNIQVVGDISKALIYAYRLKANANYELNEIESVPAYLVADYTIDSGKFLVDVMAKLYELAKPAEDVAKGVLGKTVDVHKYLKTLEDVFLKESVENELDIIIEDKLIEFGFSSLKDYIASVKSKEFEEMYKIYLEREKINTKHKEFCEHIINNEQKYLNNLDQIEQLYIEYSEPITYVFEYYPILNVTEEPFCLFTLGNLAHSYDFMKESKSLLDFVTYFFIVVIVLIGIIAAALFTLGASIPESLISLPALVEAIKAVSSVSTLLKSVIQVAMGFVVVASVVFIPIVAPEVTNRYYTAVDFIENAVEGMPATTLYVKATDTKVFGTSQIISTGHTLIITPDGKIVKLIRGSGYYTPQTVGTFKVCSILHTPQKLFYKIKVVTFNVTKPNVTLNYTTEIIENSATITAKIHNYENTTFDNLTLILGIKDSKENLTYADIKLFSINPNETKEITFNVNFNESDVYTATLTLSIMALFTLQEQRFPIVIGNATSDDVIILNTDVKDIYSPLNNVTFNITIQSFSDEPFTIEIPLFNYSQSLKFKGIETVTITLPKLPPEEYTVLIKAVRDNNTLDTKLIKFTVEAVDIAVLTFNTTKLYYEPNETVTIDMKLTNLYGNPVDANVKAKVLYPDGTEKLFDTIKIGDVYRLTFTPTINGTYVIKGVVNKEGYNIKSEDLQIIVGEMSKLKLNVSVFNNTFAITIYANGKPTDCKVTVTFDGKINQTFYTSDGRVVFESNNDTIEILADKMFYESAYVKLTKPIAVLTVNPVLVVNQTAIFDASLSYDTNGYIVKYTWDFGDGYVTTTQSPTVTHIYKHNGSYNVTLTVTNNVGLTNSTTKTVKVVFWVKGDFNGNNEVDIGDICYVAYIVVGKKPQDLRADFNNNGRVDIGDLARIAYYLIGKIDKL
jgi:PKD repeat protein